MGFNTGTAIGGAGAGAAVGTAIFPGVGTGIGAGLGFLGGGFLGPDTENKAAEQLAKQMEQASANYEEYRPLQAQARQNAYQQQMSLMSPYNNALGAMYGPGAQYDFSQAFQNPFPPGHPAGPPAPGLPPPGPGTGNAFESARAQRMGFDLEGNRGSAFTSERAGKAGFDPYGNQNFGSRPGDPGGFVSDVSTPTPPRGQPAGPPKDFHNPGQTPPLFPGKNH